MWRQVRRGDEMWECQSQSVKRFVTTVNCASRHWNVKTFIFRQRVAFDHENITNRILVASDKKKQFPVLGSLSLHEKLSRQVRLKLQFSFFLLDMHHKPLFTLPFLITKDPMKGNENLSRRLITQHKMQQQLLASPSFAARCVRRKPAIMKMHNRKLKRISLVKYSQSNEKGKLLSSTSFSSPVLKTFWNKHQESRIGFENAPSIASAEEEIAFQLKEI